MNIDATKPIQFALHKDTINLDSAYDITNDMMAGVIRRIDGTASTSDFEIRIPDVSVRVIDQDNDDLYSQTAYTSYYNYLLTNHVFFLQLFVYGKSEFIGIIEKSKIMQDIEEGFTYCEFNVPYLLYDLNNKVVNYVGTSVGDLEGLTRFLIDGQSTKQEYTGDYYAISTAYIDATFDRDTVEFDAIPETGLLIIDTEIASYSATTYVGLDGDENIIVRFTFDTRELYNTFKSNAELDQILVVALYSYTDVITKVIADIETDAYLSSSNVLMSRESGVALKYANDVHMPVKSGNNLINGNVVAWGNTAEVSGGGNNVYSTLYDGKNSEIILTTNDGVARASSGTTDNFREQWVRALQGTFGNFKTAYFRSVYSPTKVLFYEDNDEAIMQFSITYSELGIGMTDVTSIYLKDYNFYCATSIGYIDSSVADAKDYLVYQYTGLDDIYDAQIINYTNGVYQYAVIEKNTDGHVVMNLYDNLPEGAGLQTLSAWLAQGTITDTILLSTTDAVTSSGYRMYHGFVHGWGYTFDTDEGTIKKITYHDNRDLIGETINGEIFEVAINLDSMTFDLSLELTSYTYPQDYSPYLAIHATTGVVRKRKAVGYRNMYLVNINTGTDEDKIFKVRYLYDCISYTIRNKKLLDVINDFRKYYYAIIFLNRNNELVMKNIRALFANVQNTYTLTSAYVRSVRKEQYDYRDVAILPDSADISYAMRKFYEDETLRIFGQAQDVWTVTTSETIDAFYFDYVLYSGRVGVVIGKSIDFDDTNNIEYTYTLIMESPIDVFDAFSVV